MFVPPLRPQQPIARAPAAHAPPSSDDDVALAQQQQVFDRNVGIIAEAQREWNALRALSQEQMKRDDELLRKFIDMI